MDLLRRHMFFIICGVVAAGALAFGVTGIQRMPKVREEMKKVENIYPLHIVRFRKFFSNKFTGDYILIHCSDFKRVLTKLSPQDFIQMKKDHEQ